MFFLFDYFYFKHLKYYESISIYCRNKEYADNRIFFESLMKLATILAGFIIGSLIGSA
jgi:hypothetical protein